MIRAILDHLSHLRSRQALYPFELACLAPEARAANQASIRSLSNVAYLGGTTALCRVLGRYKMYVDTVLDYGLSPHLMLEGYWEMWLTEVMTQVVKPGMVVADIGANLGYYTLMMAELVGPGGRVHAFEPDPRMAELMTKSIWVNGFREIASVHAIPLGDEDGAAMSIVDQHDGSGRASLSFSSGEVPEGGALVHTRRLDSDPDWQRIELAKIDVDGFEQLIWAGAKGLLDSSALRTVIIEFAAARYADPAAFLEQLLAPGFSLALVDYTKGVIPVTREQVLARDPLEDLLLFLTR